MGFRVHDALHQAPQAAGCAMEVDALSCAQKQQLQRHGERTLENRPTGNLSTKWVAIQRPIFGAVASRIAASRRSTRK